MVDNGLTSQLSVSLSRSNPTEMSVLVQCKRSAQDLRHVYNLKAKKGQLTLYSHLQDALLPNADAVRFVVIKYPLLSLKCHCTQT